MTCSLTCGMWPHYSPRCPVQVIEEHLFCEKGTVCLIGTVTLTFLRTAIRVSYPFFSDHLFSNTSASRPTRFCRSRVWPFLHSFIPWSVVRHFLFQERVPHIVRSSASSFSFYCPLVSLKSSSICLRLLPHISIPSLLPSTFPSVTCFKTHFLRQNITNLFI